jgi:hypothetical protein
LTAASRRRVEAATLVDCRGVEGSSGRNSFWNAVRLMPVRANRVWHHHVLARLPGTAVAIHKLEGNCRGLGHDSRSSGIMIYILLNR